MKVSAIALAAALACAPITARAECTPGVASQDQKAIEVIDGLYVSLLGRHAEPAGQAYWSGGTTIGSALIFGYVAGLNAAREAERGV